MVSIINPLEEVMVGNDAAWLLHFSNNEDDETSTFGRDNYYANIQASLPSGLEGGIYKFDLIGLSDEDYAKIAPTNDQNSTTNKQIYVDLYLYWRDTTSALGYLKSLASLTDSLGEVTPGDVSDYLIAKLAVTRVSRKIDGSQYTTQVEAKEAVFHKAQNKRVCGEQSPQLILELAQSLADSAEIEKEAYPIEACTLQDANQQMQPDQSQSVLENLTSINTAIEQLTCKRGRGLLLVRDGKLHIGQRPIPLSESDIDLSESNGLIEVEALANVVTDPNFNPCEGGEGSMPPTRKQYKLTLKGRPDIKPGSVVKLTKPSTEMTPVTGNWTGIYGDLAVAAVSGSLLPSLSGLGDDTIRMYVSSVEHRLGKSSGFVTTVTGVTIDSDNDDGWDTYTDSSNQNRDNTAIQAATPEQQVADSTRRVVQREFNQYAFSEVAEVRSMNVQDQDDVFAQTETLWRGLANEDGISNQSRRLDIRRPSERPFDQVPYLSPFAWGKCGLVLPRYPGMRVVTTHRQALGSDPIDIGALWKSGDTPASEAGDWWLSLPAAVEESKRTSINDDEVIAGYEGKTSNDLIDADGNRVLEVGSFTLRFVSDGLNDAGTRPSVAEADSVTIENSNATSYIKMKKDGSIEIKGQGIKLDADGGDITLSANKVKVE